MFLMAVPKVNRTTRSLSTSNTINVQQQMIKVIWNMIIRLQQNYGRRSSRDYLLPVIMSHNHETGQAVLYLTSITANCHRQTQELRTRDRYYFISLQTCMHANKECHFHIDFITIGQFKRLCFCKGLTSSSSSLVIYFQMDTSFSSYSIMLIQIIKFFYACTFQSYTLYVYMNHILSFSDGLRERLTRMNMFHQSTDACFTTNP